MLQPRILEVTPLSAYRLKLRYETGETRLFDVAPYLTGEWFGKLKDKNQFNTVHLISGGTGIEWEDGQDIAPHELYEKSELIS